MYRDCFDCITSTTIIANDIRAIAKSYAYIIQRYQNYAISFIISHLSYLTCTPIVQVNSAEKIRGLIFRALI